MAERVNQSAVETVAGRVDKSVGKRMRGGEREREHENRCASFKHLAVNMNDGRVVGDDYN